MAPQTTCVNCGYSAEAATDDWERADHPTLGTLTQCPQCRSTNIHQRD